MSAPRRNLPPESEPWGRWVTDQLGGLGRATGIHDTAVSALRAQSAAVASSSSDHQAHIENTLRVPAAPGNVTASSTANIETGGTVTAAVSVTADQVTTDIDEATLAISKYELYGRPDDTGAIWRRLCDLPAPGVDEDADDPTVTLDAQPLPSGKTWQFKVRAISLLGALGQFSDPVTTTLAGDTTAPPTPSTPTLTTKLGTVTIAWDGLDHQGNAVPDDFSHCDVKRGTTVVGSLGSAGSLVDARLDVGTEYTYTLTAVDTSGNTSDASTSASVTVQGVDLSALDNDVSDAIDAAQDAADAAQADVDTLTNTTLPGLQSNLSDAQDDIDTLNNTTIPGIQSDVSDAQSDATDAYNAAQAAQGIANTALTTADGKNKVIFSTSNASGTSGYVEGDIWFKRTGTIITGYWEFTNGAWDSRTLDNAVIANLNAGKLTAGTIDADRIGAETITAGKIAAHAITAAQIAAGAITATELGAGSVTTEKLAAGAVTAAKIEAGTITSNEIAANTITAAEIKGGTITATELASDSVTAGKIAANAVTANSIDAGAVDGMVITGATIQTDSGTTTGVKLDDNGLKAYNSSGTETVSIDAATGKLTATDGEFSGDVTGSTISGSLIQASETSGGITTVTSMSSNGVIKQEYQAGTSGVTVKIQYGRINVIGADSDNSTVTMTPYRILFDRDTPHYGNTDNGADFNLLSAGILGISTTNDGGRLVLMVGQDDATHPYLASLATTDRTVSNPVIGTSDVEPHLVGIDGDGKFGIIWQALPDDFIPDLPASKITSGTFGSGRIPSLPASKITSGTFATARIPDLSASKITSGTIDEARLPTDIAGKAYAIAAGTGSNAVAAYGDITFPAGRFTQPPLVIGATYGAVTGAFNVQSGSVTTAGCKAGAFNPATNGAVAAHWYWVAIQMTANSATG